MFRETLMPAIDSLPCRYSLNGHSDIVDMLLAAGADVDVKSRLGTPADWAASKHPELAARLRALQADPTEAATRRASRRSSSALID